MSIHWFEFAVIFCVIFCLTVLFLSERACRKDAERFKDYWYKDSQKWRNEYFNLSRKIIKSNKKL